MTGRCSWPGEAAEYVAYRMKVSAADAEALAAAVYALEEDTGEEG